MTVGFTADSFGSGDSGAAAPAAPAAPSAPAVPASEKITAPTDGSEVDARASLADAARAAVKPDEETPAVGELDSAADPLEAPDPLDEEFFGDKKLKARDLLAKLRDGDGLLPEELLDLEHEYTFGEGDDAETVRMTLREALDQGHAERMQLRNYHRQVHEVRQFEQQVVARGRAMEAAIKGLNNPDTMFEDLQGLGVEEDKLLEAAKRYARQRVDYMNMSPSQRAMIDGQRAMRQQLLQQQRELNELRSHKTQNEEQTFQQKAKSALRQHMPDAFKKHGLQLESERAKAQFYFFLEKAADGKAPTRDVIYKAALAARQDFDLEKRNERAAAATAAGKRAPAGKPLGPRSGAAPAALKVPAQANGRSRGMTAEEFGR